MVYRFVETVAFTRRWYAIGLTDEDLRELQIFLMEHPQAGPMMQGTGGVRKLRWAGAGRGKSGGVRTIYLELAADHEIWLITVFDKHSQANLSDEQKKIIKQFVTELKGDSK